MADLDLAEDDAAPEQEPAAAKAGGGFDMGLVAGIVVTFAALIAGLYMEGSTIGKYVGPSAFLIVFGGTMGVTLTSFGIPAMKNLPATFMYALRYTRIDRISTIHLLVRFAEKARREGLLVLEDDLRSAPDEFTRRGVQLVVDGTDPDLVKEILHTEVDSLHDERVSGAKVWEAMSGFSPTLGIIGTVIGLVLVLSNISDPSSLAASIAVAFIATLYGVGLANTIYLPFAMKIKSCAEDEVQGRELVIEGILAIQSGDNPRIVEEKLVAYLSTRDRATFRAAKASAEAADADVDLAA